MTASEALALSKQTNESINRRTHKGTDMDNLLSLVWAYALRGKLSVVLILTDKQYKKFESLGYAFQCIGRGEEERAYLVSWDKK